MSAVSRGHEVIIFNMDDGTKLLGKPSFLSLCEVSGVTMSFCDYGAKKIKAPTEGIPGDISCGSQFDNANMVHQADKVIVV